MKQNIMDRCKSQIDNIICLCYEGWSPQVAAKKCGINWYASRHILIELSLELKLILNEYNIDCENKSFYHREKYNMTKKEIEHKLPKIISNLKSGWSPHMSVHMEGLRWTSSKAFLLKNDEVKHLIDLHKNRMRLKNQGTSTSML